jgi:hypothetical protein
LDTHKSIYSQRAVTESGSSKAHGACAAPTNQAKGSNLIFNLQFQIPSLLQSFLKFSISGFAFLCTLLICWKKII